MSHFEQTCMVGISTTFSKRWCKFQADSALTHRHIPIGQDTFRSTGVHRHGAWGRPTSFFQAERQLGFSHLISSTLLSPHLISPHLLSSHLISSQLVSSHLISSHLISTRPVSPYLIWMNGWFVFRAIRLPKRKPTRRPRTPPSFPNITRWANERGN